MKATLYNVHGNRDAAVTTDQVSEQMLTWSRAVVSLYKLNTKGHWNLLAAGTHDKVTWFSSLVAQASRIAGVEGSKLRVTLSPYGDSSVARELRYNLRLERDDAEVIADLQRRVAALEGSPMRVADFMPPAPPSRLSGAYFSPPGERFSYLKSFLAREDVRNGDWPSERHQLYWFGSGVEQHPLRPAFVEELLSCCQYVHARVTSARNDDSVQVSFRQSDGPFLEQLLARIAGASSRRPGPFRVAVLGFPMPRVPGDNDESFVFYINPPERE